MKEIPLTQGQVAKVSDEDYERVKHLHWYAAHSRRGFIAQRGIVYAKGKERTELMSRFILGAQPGEQVDHINHDTLDNQRQNLRRCTAVENGRNKRPRPGCTSRYKGVWLSARTGRWESELTIGGHRINVGTFAAEEEAARAHDRAVIKYHGDFAFLNFPRDDYGPAELIEVIPHPGPRARGERIHGHKLTEDDVRELRRLHREGWGCNRLGEKFGIDRTSAWAVFRGYTWKHIPMEDGKA